MNLYCKSATDYHSLSVKDLLEAREAYHVHLSHLENVVATAIGRYRICDGDPDANDHSRRRESGATRVRTLENSAVKSWSWPCVLVFVKKWLAPEDFRSEPEQFVPRFLYMPDGRVVPTCVVYVEEANRLRPPLQGLTFPADMLGGGYPVLTEIQGKTHVGSLGCMVTDGETSYALTNRHVTGESGTEICSIIRGKRDAIGFADKRQLGKKPFSEVYPGWPGTHSVCNLDVGLVRVRDVNDWSAQIFGLGELDKLMDLHRDSISLKLIGCPVRAFGSASGAMFGEVQALFYRYKSVGGMDYVADVLIGPRQTGGLMTQPGDSGTLWCFDPEPLGNEGKIEKGKKAKRLSPVALQWGGHELLGASDETTFSFALATFVSTICRELDVEVIRDWNIGHNEYWGKTGHYKIAATACRLVKDPSLHQLLAHNLSQIAFDDNSIQAGQIEKIDAGQFVPLADVPDLVWRNSRPKDSANHFADMDEVGKGEFAGKTLLDLCADPANVNTRVWNKFYDSLEIGYKRGALPFRVWQLYEAMVASLKNGAAPIPEFVCAAGILAHYVADACISLHISRLHHGSTESEQRVHSTYENAMVDRFTPELIAGVNAKLATAKMGALHKGGHAAAVSVIRLMRETITTLPPEEIIEAFNAAEGQARTKHMWSVLGQRTIECIANGCLCLATLWESAWQEGGGPSIKADQLVKVERNTLANLYNDKKFLPASWLKELELPI